MQMDIPAMSVLRHGLLVIVLLILCACSSSSRAFEVHSGSSSKQYSLYIVYLGGKGSRDSASLIHSHHQMLAAVTESEVESYAKIVHSYKHSFNGFSARMTKEQADAIAKMPRVLSVFPSKTYQLHTTRSWEFLGVYELQKSSTYLKDSEDVIVGILDTGIWPESESFSDSGLGPAPSRWKGTCNNTGVTNSSELVTCNNKIIGARFYSSQGFASDEQKGTAKNGTKQITYKNARDDEGHGSHTASTAAGREVKNASMLGIAAGTARGGHPTAKLAVYKVCGDFGCFEADILAAFDDAISDGVDVLSLSLGGAAQDYDEDGIAIGSFHAIEKGITVSCSAGNGGPDESSVSNSAPWIVTVAASTIDRGISASVVLGNNKTLQGTAINLNKQSKPPYKLVYAGDILKNKSLAAESSNCDPDNLDATKVKGNTIVCIFDPAIASRRTITTSLHDDGATGVILINDFYADLASYFVVPATIVKQAVGNEILAYIKQTSTPVATILPTQAVLGISPAPVVAGFSSRGPNTISPDIIKPDVTAPGVNILAAWSKTSPAFYENYDTSKPVYVSYNIISGTSMSCPHVAGAIALVKSVHPEWSPAALRSALMTTATTMDNVKEEITDYNGTSSGAFDYGSGQINPASAVDPGLIYDITPSDYVAYLCATGYSTKKIRIITGNKTTSCPKTKAASSGPPYLNYPSIGFPLLQGTQTTKRTLTNVGTSASVYTATVQQSSALEVTVSPAKLSFSGAGDKQSYTVTVTAKSSVKTWQYVSLTWTDGTHIVHSPIAVKSS